MQNFDALNPDNLNSKFDRIADELFDVEVAANGLLATEGQPVGAEYLVNLDPARYGVGLGGLACTRQLGTSVDDSSIYD